MLQNALSNFKKLFFNPRVKKSKVKLGQYFGVPRQHYPDFVLNDIKKIFNLYYLKLDIQFYILDS